MRRISIRLLMVSLVLVVFVLNVHAQATRTWVSGVGNDANPCSRTAPCKTFAGAISKTIAGGEISVLDPGGYGAVTITKSITINGRGTLASTLASGVNGVVIQGGANDIISLRYLDINGAPPTAPGPGINGIRFLSGKTLNVEHCNIFGFRNTTAGNGRGISIVPTGAVTMNVYVSDTTITDGGGAGIGISPAAAGPTVNLYVVNSTIKQLDATGSTSGIFAGFGARVIIRDSDIAGMTVAGIDAAQDSRVLVEHCTLVNNARGVQLSNSATVRLSNSFIANNATAGFVENVGTNIESLNDNVFMNNGANVGTLTDVLPD